jgi:phosphomannomutase / phosphoglucomutase
VRAAQDVAVADHVARCADEVKYGVIEQVVKHFEAARTRTRAAPGKPELVVLVESPVSEARMRDRFEAIGAAHA